MKKLLFLLIFWCMTLPASNQCLAISQSQTLTINVKISARSRIIIDRTEIPLSNDPQQDTAMYANFMNISSETKTGRASETSLETMVELVRKGGDTVPLKRTSAVVSGAQAKVAWKRPDGNRFQEEIWDKLIENLSYQGNAAGPYAPVITYTLVTP